MLGFAAYGQGTPEQVLAKILPWAMCIIGVEIILNLVLDIYRPRKPDEIPRPAFDSRLLGLISEPGGIARTIADAVNYQFGFEVSKTWFYQLLQRWAFVLLGVAILVLFLMTCVVVVEPGEQAVVERFGNPRGLTDRSVAALEPGIHLKLPWPIDRATRYPVDRIRTILLGFGPWKRKPYEDPWEGAPKLILWTNPIHGPGEELDFMMPVRPDVERAVTSTRPATPRDGPSEGPRTPAVNLIRIALPVMYRVKDLYQFIFNYVDPEALIESSAYGELGKFVASKDLDTLLAVERREASDELRALIQARCDELAVGVEITFVGLQNIHPPQRAAKEFEAYLNARYEKGAAIAKAEGEANKLLTEAAGSRKRAEHLGKAIQDAQRLIGTGAAETEASRMLERLFERKPGDPAGISGEVAQIVALARADRWSKENTARGRAASFAKELTAYRSAPQLYKMRRIVEVLMEGLAAVDKYVIARDSEVFIRYEAIQRERVQLEDIDYNVPPD
jgi:regulator of protease activity HflC (stomatin/prohibitin superfamily)